MVSHGAAHCGLDATRDTSARLYKIDHLSFSVTAVQLLWKRRNAPFTVASRGTPKRFISVYVQVFGRDRRVGECLLLREERKSGLRGPISVLDPKRTQGFLCFVPRRQPRCGRPPWVDLDVLDREGLFEAPRFGLLLGGLNSALFQPI